MVGSAVGAVALPLTALTVLDTSAYQPAPPFSGPVPPRGPSLGPGARAGDLTGRNDVAGNQTSQAATRRRRQLWAGVLALVGLVLLIIGVTVADGIAAWVEVVVAILLLVTSYVVQHLARRDIVYQPDERR